MVQGSHSKIRDRLFSYSTGKTSLLHRLRECVSGKNGRGGSQLSWQIPELPYGNRTKALGVIFVRFPGTVTKLALWLMAVG